MTAALMVLTMLEMVLGHSEFEFFEPPDRKWSLKVLLHLKIFFFNFGVLNFFKISIYSHV